MELGLCTIRGFKVAFTKGMRLMQNAWTFGVCFVKGFESSMKHEYDLYFANELELCMLPGFCCVFWNGLGIMHDA
jgi:hypothetical protein